MGVALDVVIRAAVIVVVVSLIRELRASRIEPDGDGVPVRLLIGPLVLFIGWNGHRMVRSIRAWRASTVADPPFLASVGLVRPGRS